MENILYITVAAPFGEQESFIMKEMVALRKAGASMLIAPRTKGNGRVFHQEGRTLLDCTLTYPLLDLRMIGIFIRELFTNRKFRFLLKKVAFRSRRPAILVKNLIVMPKSVFLYKIIRKKNISHIHVHWGATTATMGYLISKLSDIPISITVHRGDIWQNNLLKEKVVSSRFVRCISEKGKNDLLKITGERYGHKVEVIHMGAVVPGADKEGQDISRSAGRSAPAGAINIAVPANLIKLKGHVFLVDACKIMARSEGRYFKIFFYGSGPFEKVLKKKIRHEDLSGLIEMPGRIDNGMLLGKYDKNEIDVVVLPSVTTESGECEGIPVSLMEAMAYGVPVVATDTGAIPELLNGGAGLMVPEKDPAALADAVIKLSGDADLYAGISRRGYERVAEHFNIDNISGRLLQRIMEKKGR